MGKEVQSALEPIKASLYAPANTTQNQTPYWFTIPSTGTVLIAMQKGETVPKIGTNGKSNFDYVTDNVSPNQTHFTLPAGLYFWRTNTAKHFSNRPIIQGKPGRSFISTASGYWWDQSKRTNQNDKWDATRFASNPHPFELKSIPLLVQAIPSAASAASAGGSAATASAKTQAEIKAFSIASNNILNEAFYPRHVGIHKDLMRLNARQQIFTAAFSNEKLLKGKQIICFQEWSSKGSLNVPDAYSKNGFAQDGAGLFTWVDPKTFSVKSYSYQAFATPGAEQRGFLAIYLQTNDENKRTACVINTHFVGGPGPKNTTYQQFREDQMQEIAQYIQNNAQMAQSWIVCGDLNSNATQVQIYSAVLNEIGQAGLVDAELLTDQQRPATSYNKGPESMDYIFYSSNTLNAKNISYYPPFSSQNLITHGHLPGDAQKPFYSDHCVVWATFSFASQATAKSAAAQPAASTSSGATAAAGSATMPTYAQPKPAAAKKAASNWTDAHTEIANLMTNASKENLELAAVLLESAIHERAIDLTTRNKEGKTLREIADKEALDAFENPLAGDTSYDEASWKAIIKQLSQ